MFFWNSLAFSFILNFINYQTLRKNIYFLNILKIFLKTYHKSQVYGKILEIYSLSQDQFLIGFYRRDKEK